MEEIERLSDNFIDLGVEKIRLTGGEPLVRKDIIKLIEKLNYKKNSTNLKEITLTTNGTLLKNYSYELKQNGVNRINVSLDTIDEDKYNQITRFGKIKNVFDGINEAKKNKIKIKINTVVFKNFNEMELENLIEWSNSNNHDLTFIEVMPMDETDSPRDLQFVPLNTIYEKLDSDLARAMMSINAVKGVEIGSGFDSVNLSGENSVDEIRMKNKKVKFLTNNAGGILGGISTGQQIVIRFCVKPTSSILNHRKTINKNFKETNISTKGRHDPCVGIRAVPVGEAMMAVTLADHWLRLKATKIN